MMLRSAPPTFPEALDDDNDDVTWALQTAAVQWKRGAHSDAVEWLRRAAESAVDSGRAIRARELTQQTNAIEAALRAGSSRPPTSSREMVSGRYSSSSRAPGSTPPPASARPFPLRTPRPPPNPFAAPPVAANPFTSGPALNPFSSGRTSSRPPAARAPFVDEDREGSVEPDAYGELAVDIEMEPASVAPQSRRDLAPQPTELSEDELVEEVDEIDEIDLAALSAPRRQVPRAPFVSAPELETGPALEADLDLEAADYIDADEEGEDDERPTLPPSSSNKDRPVVVPSTLRDEIDELLGKPVRRSNRVGPQASSEPAAREPAARQPASRERLAKEPAAKRTDASARPSVEHHLQEEEEPTERSLEAAPQLEPPFSEQPPEETTERDLESERKLAPVPSSRRREKLPDSEPGTSPDLHVPFAASDSTPPTEPSRDDTSSAPASGKNESEAETTISEPAPAISEPPPALSDPPILLSDFPQPALSDPPILLSDFPPLVSDPPILVSERPAFSDPPILLSDIPPLVSQPLVSEPPIVLSDIPASASEPPIILSHLQVELSEPPPATAPPIASSEPPALASEPAKAPSKPASSGPRTTDRARAAEIGGVLLSQVRGLEDLPDESQAQLVDSAQLHTLAANEEVAGFGLALVVDGAVAVMAEVADVAAAQARRGELVFSQGHLEEGIRMRVVAGVSGAQVATWPYEAFSSAITECPWVGDELKGVGDRFQALAGVAMGPMGDQLDDMLRAMVIERCEVKRLLPGEVIAHAGKPMPGMVVVGAGRLEVVDGEGSAARVLEELHPGDFLFAPQILQASPAPASARAGKGGALVLFAERKIAHELLVGVPPLLGIFAC
jgi:hypothetical protein